MHAYNILKFVQAGGDENQVSYLYGLNITPINDSNAIRLSILGHPLFYQCIQYYQLNLIEYCQEYNKEGKRVSNVLCTVCNNVTSHLVNVTMQSTEKLTFMPTLCFF